MIILQTNNDFMNMTHAVCLERIIHKRENIKQEFYQLFKSQCNANRIEENKPKS